MTEIRLTVTLLDAAGDVVAWAFMRAVPRGDGALWPTEPFVAEAERDTRIVERVVHWADLNVGQRASCDLGSHLVGAKLYFRFADPLIQFETPAWTVPCVTVRGNASVAPGVGVLGVA